MVLSETGTETKCRDHEEQYRSQILGDKPLSVIRGEGASDGAQQQGEKDGGTDGGGAVDGRNSSIAHEEARKGMLAAMKRLDEELKREQLKLSRNRRFRNVAGCGHDVNQIRPDVVAEEIRWVLANVKYEDVGKMHDTSSRRFRADLISKIRRIFRLHPST